MTDTKGRFCPGSMIYFIIEDDEREGAAKGARAAERFVDFIAENAYAISLAVSLGQIKTLIECPYFMTHAPLPDEEKRRRGIVPGGIRLSCGLEDWEDIVADLREGLDAIQTVDTPRMHRAAR